MDATLDASREGASYRSPLRVLVEWFRRSRDNWKQKYLEVKAEIKRFKNRAYDLEKSRDRWKAEATSHQHQLEALQVEVEQLKAQVMEREECSGKKSSRSRRSNRPRPAGV